MHTSPFCFAALLLTATSTLFDVRNRRIPNWLTLTALLVAPACWALRMRGSPGAFSIPAPALFAGLSVLGGGLCAAVPLVLFRFSMIGGGDVKLLACLGALTLPGTGLLIEWLSLATAALLIPAILTYRGRLLPTLIDSCAYAASALTSAERRRPAPAALRETIRFSPYVFIATIVTILLEGAV